MQNLFGRTSWSRAVKLSLYICCAIFLIVSVPKCSSSQSLSSEKSVVIDDKDKQNDSYQIIHVFEVTSNDEHVITYQPEEQSLDILKSTNDPRTIEVKSKGFSIPTQLIVTQFKDSCSSRKNASLPSWKIDKGTTKGDFQLKINYEQRLTEGDFYFCVRDEKREQHLGLSSAFRLSR